MQGVFNQALNADEHKRIRQANLSVMHPTAAAKQETNYRSRKDKAVRATYTRPVPPQSPWSYFIQTPEEFFKTGLLPTPTGDCSGKEPGLYWKSPFTKVKYARDKAVMESYTSPQSPSLPSLRPASEPWSYFSQTPEEFFRTGQLPSRPTRNCTGEKPGLFWKSPFVKARRA